MILTVLPSKKFCCALALLCTPSAANAALKRKPHRVLKYDFVRDVIILSNIMVVLSFRAGPVVACAALSVWSRLIGLDRFPRHLRHIGGKFPQATRRRFDIGAVGRADVHVL